MKVKAQVSEKAKIRNQQDLTRIRQFHKSQVATLKSSLRCLLDSKACSRVDRCSDVVVADERIDYCHRRHLTQQNNSRTNILNYERTTSYQDRSKQEPKHPRPGKQKF